MYLLGVFPGVINLWFNCFSIYEKQHGQQLRNRNTKWFSLTFLEFRKGCWDTTYPSSLTTQHLGSSNKGLVGSTGGGNGTSGVGGINTNSVSSGK